MAIESGFFVDYPISSWYIVGVANDGLCVYPDVLTGVTK